MKTIVLAISLSLAAFSAGAQTSTSNSTDVGIVRVDQCGQQPGHHAEFQQQRVQHPAQCAAGGRAELLWLILFGQLHGVRRGGGGAVVGFGMNIAIPIEDQKCSLRRNFERTMQAAASTKDADPLAPP